MKAKKALGQHFLVDENVLGVIGRLAKLDPEDVVLEVGPGHGVLTRFLAERVRVVHAVEVDRSLEEPLADVLAGVENVTVTFGDAVRLDLGAFDPAPRKLVSNLPYNVATPLVVESLEHVPSLELWCVMNESGRSISAAARFFKVAPEDVLVVHDDVDLEVGRLQARLGGGLAGHNGLRSIARVLGTQEFLRLRIGVGRPGRGDRRPIADYVLSPFAPEDDVDAIVDAAADAVESLVSEGLGVAQRRFN